MIVSRCGFQFSAASVERNSLAVRVCTGVACIALMNPRTTERDLIELLDSLRTAAAR